ncbi:MAG: dihydroxyacetone kinase [Chloroflexi bacterium RBG_13_51_36]|nr:MAG: dihydroxyacetone kinase [Chloroflexi bacterium RBG_13_51_36]
MKSDLADGKTLKEMFAAGTAWLQKSAPDINAINVFPVPDGDTGTNMVLTMQFALGEVKSNSDNQACSVAKSLAHGALMGARGNSGVILSQFFRGFAKGLEGKASFDGGDFARALARASQTAYKGIANPVEGTILTVLKDASKAAQEAGRNDAALVSVLEAAVKSAEESVARTPSLLPALRDAGVVDAGGQGLYVLLDGALQLLKGESQKIQYRRPRLVVAERESVPRTAQRLTHLEAPHGYCTNFVLEGQSLGLDKIEKDLTKKGQSLIVTGDDTLVRIHIHSFKPGEILEYATKLGKLHEITINNMDDQYAEFIKMQRERMPQVDIAMVTVATGAGFFDLLNSLGDIIIVPGGQTMNPSVRELLQAVESAPSNNIILLPNNKNIVSAASQVRSLTSKKVKVIPSRNIPQGIAAFLAFGYDLNLEQNARVMEKAIDKVKAIEVTRAVRDTRLNGLEVKKGQFIAILNDDDLLARADKIEDTILEALGKAGAEKAEIVTVYYGAEIKDTEAQELAREIRDRYHAGVEVIYGGQPHYDYVISLE